MAWPPGQVPGIVRVGHATAGLLCGVDLINHDVPVAWPWLWTSQSPTSRLVCDLICLGVIIVSSICDPINSCSTLGVSSLALWSPLATGDMVSGLPSAPRSPLVPAKRSRAPWSREYDLD